MTDGDGSFFNLELPRVCICASDNDGLTLSEMSGCVTVTRKDSVDSLQDGVGFKDRISTTLARWRWPCDSARRAPRSDERRGWRRGPRAVVWGRQPRELLVSSDFWSGHGKVADGLQHEVWPTQCVMVAEGCKKSGISSSVLGAKAKEGTETPP